MPTIIDSLFLEVGLDPTKFSAGAKEIESHLRKMEEGASKGAKGVEDSSKKMDESLGSVGTRLLELATLFTGGVGITAFLGYVVKSAAELGRLSKVLDTNAQDLWAWEKIGTQVGATGGEIAGSWQGLVHTFNDFAIGLPAANAKFIRFFTEQGVQFTDASGKLRSMTDVYMQLARVVEGMDPARAEAYLRGLGLSPGTINLVLQGVDKLSKALAEAKKSAISDADIKAAAGAQREFNDTWAKTIGLASKLLPIVNVALQLVNNFAAGVKAIFDWLDDWYKQSEFRKWVQAYYKMQGAGGDQNVPGVGWVPGMPLGGGGGTGPASGSPSPLPAAHAPGGKTGLSGWPTYGLGGTGSLAGDRTKYAQELENNPMLREKLLAISAAENNDPGANLAVMETMMNRASARGTSLAAQLGFANQGGYYPTANYGALRTKKREMYEENLRRALAGSNVSQFATDNSSGSLAARDVTTGRFDETVPNMNGEHFFIPRGQGGGKNRRNFDIWRAGLDSQAVLQGEWGNNARAVPWLNNPAAFALQPGGRVGSNTTNNSSTAETHVGSVTVHTQATDAYGIARDMKAALERFGSVGNANNGPN